MDDIFKSAKKLISFKPKSNEKPPQKGIINAVRWGHPYEYTELDLEGYEGFEHMANNIGYELHFLFGDPLAIIVQVFRYTGKTKSINVKNENPMPRFVAVQKDQFDYEVIILENVLELNEYL